MKTLANLIVKGNKIILFLFILLAIAGGVLMFQVNINADMTQYLPDSSDAKQGVAILDEEFPAASTFTLMFKDLADDRKQAVYEELQTVDGVQLVSWDDTDRYNSGEYTLYEITVSSRAASDEAQATVERVEALYPDDTLYVSGDAPGNTALSRLPVMLIVAGALLLLVLFIMGTSWVEPLLFLITIGIAILLNMGTNILFDSVSEITYSIAAILQVVLSIDYSIMLLTRYRLEKSKGGTKQEAMARALQNGFTAISGSSLTTIVGMLALTLMSFTIGMDLGLVLAKGVFFSLLCIFTVMPALVLIFDSAMEKTKKKTFLPKMVKVGAFEHKGRYVILAVFALLLVGSFFLRNNVDITYSMSNYYEVNDVFAVSNPIVVIYDNDDEAAIAPLLTELAADARIDSVDSYATTLGKEYTADEFAELTGMNSMIVSQLFAAYGADSAPLSDLLAYIQTMLTQNPTYASMLPADALEELASAADNFVGSAHSRAILNTTLPEEGEETFALIDLIKTTLDQSGADYLLVGNSAIAYEMNQTFPAEMNRITILTVIAIFLIVALVFRKFYIPLILTLIIQCAVWITMGTTYLQGISMYYLPLLIVQCLLLGAMVDYGILYADYYREARKAMPKRTAITFALHSAIHTILTSGLVLVSVTTAIGLIYVAAEPAISEILLTIARGGAIAVILIVFVLPGVLAALDRGKETETGTGDHEE
ncbi:MAG TPA: efflux RND transporter permease subunit [Candidatus Limiplasma sp.]|nr:efflux RND transporter permease subunit [Candidatus Limiplasma sp.]